MPSLAQGAGRGMLLGLQLQDAQDQRERQRIQDERTGLLNELTRQRIKDIEETRKLVKQQTFQKGMQDIAEQHQAAATGVNLRDLLLSGGATKSQAGLAELGYYGSGKMPSQVFDMIKPASPKEPKEYETDRDINRMASVIMNENFGIGPYPQPSPGEARRKATGLVMGKKYSSTEKWEYIKSLTMKDPADLTEEEKRYLIGEGYRYDKTLRAWAEPKAKGNIYNTGNPAVDAALNAAHGGGGETQGGGEADETQQINYEGLAKGLTKEHGITTKQTLEAFKDELMQLYPGLKWETLKTYFK